MTINVTKGSFEQAIDLVAIIGASTRCADNYMSTQMSQTTRMLGKNKETSPRCAFILSITTGSHRRGTPLSTKSSYLRGETTRQTMFFRPFLSNKKDAFNY